ncbi:MAG: hypothetical protein ICV83_02085 [Cytophagales bacterium]|nr:hypothetical protein [Cytophagales bacterium]
MPIEVKQVQESTVAHPVNPDEDVFLTVTIGNAQLGASLVVDGSGNTLAKGDIAKVNLGRGSSLLGTAITVFTNVLDVNDVDPNNGVVVVDHFTNVRNDYLYKDTAPQGGIVSFTKHYRFV